MDYDGFVKIGNYVTVGHSAVLHGCEIQDEVMIGMNATVLEGARVGRNCIIAANALVRRNEVIPDSSLVAGVPAVIKRKGTNRDLIVQNALIYSELSRRYQMGERVFPASEVAELMRTYKKRGLP